MKIQPLHDRVIVARAPGESKSPGGIHIPEVAKEATAEATVIAAGPGRTLDSGTLIAMTVRAGDRVIIGKYAGSEVKLNGETYLVLREEDILGVLR